MNFKFDRISLDEGLSQSVVYKIIQDSAGFIWLCTQDGLNKYDGYKFTVFQNNSNDNGSLIHSHVESVFEDSSGNLWIGSSYGALSKYDRTTDKFTNFIFKNGSKEKISNAAIMGMTQINNNFLILATYGNGLVKFNMVDFKYEFIQQKIINHKKNSFILCISKNNEKIIFGTEGNGLGIYDIEEETFLNHKWESESSNIQQKNIVRTIYKKNDGNFLIGTNTGIHETEITSNGVKEFDRIQKIDNTLNHIAITAICEDKHENLWVGTRYKGVYFIDKQTGFCRNIRSNVNDTQTLSSDIIMSILNDRSNVTWLGTLGEGICKHDGEAKKFFHIPEIRDIRNNVSSKTVVSFTEDNLHNIWIGSFGKGLFMYKKSACEMTNFNHDPLVKKSLGGVSVMAMVFDGTDLWIGLQRGALNKYNFSEEDFEKYEHTNEDKIFALLNDKINPGKYLLIGTDSKGILKFDKEKKEFTSFDVFNGYDLSTQFIKCMYFDSQNDLWIGTYSGDGLFRVNIKYKKTINYKSSKNLRNGISDNNIMVIHEDKYGVIWIGTKSQGLNKFERKSGKFKVFTTEHGLSNNSIRGILEDEQENLWISTNKGISRFNLRTESFTNYDSSDGLQSNEFNDGAFYKTNDSTMYFGGINGFNYFKADEIQSNPYIPDVAVTDFQIFNHSVESSEDNSFINEHISVAEEINLTYRESVFSFEFASLIYNNQSKNQYAYMMDGFDKEWIYSGSRRFATYTNLEPGDYTFRVKGSNNDGKWNEQGTSIKIKISPPYWKTWWFKSLGVLSVLGASGMAYTKKLSVIEKEKKAHEEFSRRLIDSQEQERKNIATELHHTIAHDVLITKNKAVMGLKNVGDQDEMKNVLNEISDLAMNTLKDVRGISYNLHPHQIERLGITKAIKSILNRTSNSSDIEFVADLEDIDNILSKELEINLFRIIQECMSNILKHSNAGRSEVKIARVENSVMVKVSDDGRGFSQMKSEGLGMRGINERVRLYKGSFSVQSIEGKGTIITILLPIK